TGRSKAAFPCIRPSDAILSWICTIAAERSTTRCCSGTFSTPGSLGVRSWSCWSGRRRLSPSPSEVSRADDGGRSCRNGSAPTHLYHSRSTWRAEPCWKDFLLDRLVQSSGERREESQSDRPAP